MAVRDLPELPGGNNVLVDANVFINALNRTSPQCVRLLDRCVREEVSGMTTIEAINEACHRLMLLEAVGMGVIARQAAYLLKRKRDAVKKLRRYWELTQTIFDDLNLAIIPLDEPRVRRADEIRTRYGLLTNDSMLIAAAREYEIRCIASHDSDFDDIDGITVYKPTDVS
ncbi:MAG: type II toxin-antitoxin system VapC family toxin [Candidatus Binataceae bacterium]